MARTQVDIPEDKLDAARRLLGASSKRETVEWALDVVLRQHGQLAFIDALAAGRFEGFTPAAVEDLRRGWGDRRCAGEAGATPSSAR